ncbi:MAG: hypothetical protein H0T73_21255 [Ardenticatenales bacterium]|nr:hypothetical protein [Ardenticatenales bacterium]
MSQALYRGVPMTAEAVTFLQHAEAAGTEPSPPLLYLLVRACRPQRLFLGASLDAIALTWLSVALAPNREDMTTKDFDLAVLGAASDWSPSVGTLRAGGLLVASASDEAHMALLDQAGGDMPWRTVVVGEQTEEALFIASPMERLPRYQESPRERFMALLLGAMQPPTLALGPNVVFDGSMKPRTTRVNFSGTGGQIGAGDLLIAYPEDIQRFTPLPGAVALLLGTVETPLQTPHLALPFEDGALTLVVA